MSTLANAIFGVMIGMLSVIIAIIAVFISGVSFYDNNYADGVVSLIVAGAMIPFFILGINLLAKAMKPTI